MASSNAAAAARGDAEQAPFDRELSHRPEIPHLRVQGIVYRPLVWTADGRPHTAVTRTVQNAADLEACRNGQQMSTKSLGDRWKHEVQIALTRQRAATTRAVLPHTSARAEWLLAGLIDRVASHWTRAPPLDGGDNEDIASFTSQQTTARQFSNLRPLLASPSWSSLLPDVPAHPLVLECVVNGQRAVIQPLPTALQLDNRQKRLHLLVNLAVTYAFPAHTSEFSFQILDVTHVWSNRDSGVVDSDDLLALDAAVYMYIKLHLSPQRGWLPWPTTHVETWNAYSELLRSIMLLDGVLTLSWHARETSSSRRSRWPTPVGQTTWTAPRCSSRRRLRLRQSRPTMALVVSRWHSKTLCATTTRSRTSRAEDEERNAPGQPPKVLHHGLTDNVPTPRVRARRRMRTPVQVTVSSSETCVAITPGTHRFAVA